MDRTRAVAAAAPAGEPGEADTQGLTDQQTREVRTRVRLLIEIALRAGAYRKGLLTAAARLSPEEAAIIADLARHGLQVQQLHDVLCGGHVLVDDPELYEAWRFAKVSHPRISSHHRDIDKKKYPDIGMRGVVVREKLHGRTAQGTWVQLEKTPAAFGQRKLPSMDDVRHLMDYVVYRLTRSNVGPWGLSRLTERRPMYLSPALAVPAPLAPPVAESLASALRRIEAAERRHVGVRGPRRPVPAAYPGESGRRARAGAARAVGPRPIRQLRRVGHRDALPDGGLHPEPAPGTDVRTIRRTR